MLKHGLISSESYWNKFKDLSNRSFNDLDDLIYESILIKKQVVDIDPFENNLRKTLNFGHTLGHAIESYCLSNPNKTNLLHGEAIAIGIVLASYISTKLVGFPLEHALEIKHIFNNYYGVVPFDDSDFAPIMDFMKYDKKNNHGNINFVLLEAIGTPKIDCLVDESIILEAFKFYAS
jgi:3-dehydroquinate synthase